MRFKELTLKGAYLIEIDRFEDERGFFARTWCCRELEQRGIESRIVQANISQNLKAGTVRGMHFQKPPHEEAKFVRCTAGRIEDVIVDIRPESKTYLQWASVELSAENYRTLYIPKGFAHGFQTLADNSEVFYLHTEFYSPESADGLSWNDPALGIDWPIPDATIISEKDRNWPLL